MTRRGHAEAARTLLARSTSGSLATIATEPMGYPFVSVVAFALDGSGAPIMALSTLAEHTANLASDPRASLMALEGAGDDPQAAGRATVIGSCIPAADQDEARAVFLRALPDAAYAGFADFSMYRLTVERVRYVGGFGVMSWIAGADYAAAGA